MAFWNQKSEPDTASLRCSFCKKSAREVSKLIAGPEVHICNECVHLCLEVLQVDETPAPQPPSPAEVVDTHSILDARLHDHPSAIRLLARLVENNATAVGSPPTVLLVGEAGVGKSALCTALVESCGVPAAHAHVHRISATGYIGADLENLVSMVVTAAGDTPDRALRGLLVLEDLQHLAPSPGLAPTTRDVGGRDVQPHLVRLLDRRVLHLPAGSTGNIHPQADLGTFDPTHLLVVLTCRVDTLPERPDAIRPALLELGLSPELLDRIDLVVPMRMPDRAALTTIVAGPLREAVEQGTGTTLSLSDAETSTLVDLVARPGGLWNARQALFARALTP
jgi:ATP-dependent protease Clp ATPase subunit